MTKKKKKEGVRVIGGKKGRKGGKGGGRGNREGCREGRQEAGAHRSTLNEKG